MLVIITECDYIGFLLYNHLLCNLKNLVIIINLLFYLTSQVDRYIIKKYNNNYIKKTTNKMTN
jgi:hypothetical protein